MRIFQELFSPPDSIKLSVFTSIKLICAGIIYQNRFIF